MGMTNDGLSYWQAETTNTPLLNVTIGDLLDQRATEVPTNEAVVYSHYPEFGAALNFRWTYAEYRDRADEVARGLLSIGLHKGDHIAVWAVNLPEWLLLEMACAKAGLVLVTVNPAYRAAELEYVLKQGDVVALFFMAQIRDHNCITTLRALVTPGSRYGEVNSERLPKLRYACLLGAVPPTVAGVVADEWRPALFSEMITKGSSISADELRKRQAAVKPQDAVMIQYTSGTTGFPKGVLLTHYGLLNDALLTAERIEARPGDRNCVTLPFFHVGACGLAVLGALYAGAAIHPLIAFDVVRWMQVISGGRCTITGAVPTMLLAMLHHPDFSKYDLSSLRIVTAGAAAVPVHVMEQVKERIGANINIIFGQTESSGTIAMTLLDDPFALKAATVGIPLPYVDAKIIQPATNEVVSCGERGELCCRGFLVMKGYYKMPERTAEALDKDGWLHTGDLATMNKDGYVNIVGRLKEMVIRGGENIFPREIEEFLIRHPKIADVQVLGVPDAFFGEELLAVVQPKEGQQVSEQELRDYCNGKISHQKIPRYFTFVESYPMTASGKVQKYLLREKAIKDLGLVEVAKIKTA